MIYQGDLDPTCFIVDYPAVEVLNLMAYDAVRDYLLDGAATSTPVEVWKTFGESWVLQSASDEIHFVHDHPHILVRHHATRTPRGLGAQVRHLEMLASRVGAAAYAREVSAMV